jgi:hypothetical protein
MAMKKSGTGSGGGIGSKNVVHKPVITGKPASGVRPGWASQIGSAIGDHITDHGGRNLSYRGEEMKLPRGPAGGNAALGNQLVNNVGKGVPGTGREVFKAGSQGTSSPTRSPNFSGRDTLAEFGPDTSNARNRR